VLAIEAAEAANAIQHSMTDSETDEIAADQHESTRRPGDVGLHSLASIEVSSAVSARVKLSARNAPLVKWCDVWT